MPAQNHPELSIVIPVFNSEDCLEELNREIVSACAKNYSYEVIIVDDKSIDNSWKLIQKICSEDNHVVGIGFRKNYGQDNALLAGLRLAKGTFIVIMDDDLQHSPADIFTLVEKCKTGYDVCYANFRNKRQSALKNFGSLVNGRLSEILVDKPKEIYLSPFKVVKKEVVNELVKYSGPFPYIDAMILSVTSNVSQVELIHHSRFKGKGNYSLTKSIKVLLRHATGYSVVPLRIASLIGFSSAVVSFFLGVYYLFDYFYNANKVEGWITIIVLLIFFGGILLMSIGLIGEYVGRIYLSVNKNPQYTIDKIITQQTESE